MNRLRIVLPLPALLLCLLWTASAEGVGARVSYLGPQGTYTEEAAQFFFTEDETLLPMETVFAGDKTRTRVTGAFGTLSGVFSALSQLPFSAACTEY